MHGTVPPDQPGAVEQKPHGKALERRFLERLIERSLQECRVDREEGLPAGLCEPGHHVERVALADSRVEGAIRILRERTRQTGSIGHGCGRGHNARILCHHVQHDVADRRGENASFALDLDAATFTDKLAHVFSIGVHDFESARRMETAGIFLRKFIALTLHSLDVKDDGFVEIPRLAEKTHKRRDVVSVDRANRHQTEVLEPTALDLVGVEPALGSLARGVIGLFQNTAAGQTLEGFLRLLLKGSVTGAQAEAIEVMRHRALRMADAHAVVVQDDEELAFERSRAVQALHRDTVHNGSVADHRDHAPAPGRFLRIEAVAVERIPSRHADRGRNPGAGVADAKKVVRRFGRLGKTRHALPRSEIREHAQAAGQKLVRIALMADVPNQAVFRRVVQIMQRDGQLDHAESRAEMAARGGDLLDQIVAQLARNLGQLGFIELALPLESAYGAKDTSLQPLKCHRSALSPSS